MEIRTKGMGMKFRVKGNFKFKTLPSEKKFHSQMHYIAWGFLSQCTASNQGKSTFFQMIYELFE